MSQVREFKSSDLNSAVHTFYFGVPSTSAAIPSNLGTFICSFRRKMIILAKGTQLFKLLGGLI